MLSTKLSSWRKLTLHFKDIEALHLRELFADDDKRGATYILDVGDIYLDYSKNRITDQTISLLIDLAREAGVEEMREKMFSGEPINSTEKRAVLHTALRSRGDKQIMVDGKDIMPEIARVAKKMSEFSEKSTQWRMEGVYG